VKISADRPPWMARLFEASSQAQTSLGRNRASRTMYSTAARSFGLLRTVGLPSASSIDAPKDVKSAPTQSTASERLPIGRPNGTPAAWHRSAATRNASQVQYSAVKPRRSSAGPISRGSIPACCLRRSIRPSEGFILSLIHISEPTRH